MSPPTILHMALLPTASNSNKRRDSFYLGPIQVTGKGVHSCARHVYLRQNDTLEKGSRKKAGTLGKGNMTDNRKGEVVSIEKWLEMRALAQTIKSSMVYQSFIEDANSIKTQDDKDYFGLVYSIPGEDSPDHVHPLDLEQNQVFMMIDFDEEGDLFSHGGKGVERYEIHDMVTDDVHVMYRVPYRTTNLRAVTKKPKPGQE